MSDAYAERARCYRAKGDEASAKRDLEEARRLGADGGVGKGRSRARGP